MSQINTWITTPIATIARRLSFCKDCRLSRNTRKGLNLAGRDAVHQVLEELIAILFPGCHGGFVPPEDDSLSEAMEDRLLTIAMHLRQQCERAFQYQCEFEQCRDCHDCTRQSEAAVNRLLESLPAVQEILQQDMRAAYDGDPAARSIMEVVMSYPGFQAIVVHRIAHLLYAGDVPLIPRIMSEQAHSQTGIDIHPGATVGPGFFIDHGTGVVIGETCIIGRNVKLYQGVTLGAKSFPTDEHGNPIKGIKRHPEVGDNVTIYAGATILGGDTVIGAGSEIGGNVWLTHSVPPNSTVFNQQPKPMIRKQADSP
jgi:serine O-acetyltransferase